VDAVLCLGWRSMARTCMPDRERIVSLSLDSGSNRDGTGTGTGTGTCALSILFSLEGPGFTTWLSTSIFCSFIEEFFLFYVAVIFQYCIIADWGVFGCVRNADDENK